MSGGIIFSTIVLWWDTVTMTSFLKLRLDVKHIIMMSVVGKSTCSGFKTGLYISYHGGNAVWYKKKETLHYKSCK